MKKPIKNVSKTSVKSVQSAQKVRKNITKSPSNVVKKTVNPKEKLKTCKKCSHKVSPSARLCPNCGHPMGFLSWLTENKFLLLITSIVGVNGLWFVDFFEYFKPNNDDSQIHGNMDNTGNIENSNTSTNTSNNIPAIINTPSKEKCSLCNGTKQIRCPVCKDYKGSLPCTFCNGKGRQATICTKCNGRGGIYNQQQILTGYCDQCRGTGKLDCAQCNKTGFQKCFSCSNGYIPCPSGPH